MMMKVSTISKIVFLFSVMLGSFLFGQKQKIKESEEGTIVFGKVYTVEELKKTNGLIRCSSTEYEAYLQNKYPERMNEGQFEAWLHPLIEKNMANKSQNGDVITIPVVVHVIHSGQAYGSAPNITDAQVESQITVMNQDFRKMAGTRGENSLAIAADTKIQFALAKVDPNGNPTNGIDRVNMCQLAWSTDEINNIVKPQTIWDPTQYMNMWSVNFSTNGLLGYAQFPSGSNLTGLNPSGGLAETDGVVAGFYCFGSRDVDDGTFILGTGVDLGRTMTHEVGHFLGLRHLWGDGNCLTDYVNDTPFSSSANNAHYACNPTQDSCPTMPGVDMVRNYMNYTNDLCMNIFTNDQNARFAAVMNNSPRRASLKTSLKDIAIPLFVNDAEVKLERTCTGNSTDCDENSSMRISLYNRGTSNLTSATITYTVGAISETYNWSGSLMPNRYTIINLPVSSAMPSGNMTVSVATANGGADQRATNNSFVAAYVSSLPAQANNGAFTFTLQNDYWASETTWNLKNSAGTIVYQSTPYTDVPNPNQNTPLPTPIVETWNLTSGCYTFTINDLYGDGMYDYGNYNLKNSAGTIVFEGNGFAYAQTKAVNITVLSTGEVKLDQFAVYPNPATDLLNITKVSNKAKYEIHNAVGQLVKAGEINNNQVRVAELIKGTYIITINDKNISESIKFIKK